MYGVLFIGSNTRIGGIGILTQPDLLMTIYGVNKKTCIAYNELLSVNNPSGNPPVGRIYADVNGRYKGTMVGGTGMALTPGLDLYGQTTGCGNASPAGNVNIYMVLEAR